MKPLALQTPNELLESFRSLTQEQIQDYLASLTGEQKRELDALLTAPSAPEPPSLRDFVEATFPFGLDPWQDVLCERLEKLRWQTGQRILIHAPPQVGKSVIVSQRFPAWLIGCNPTARVKLATYNISHSTEFSKINLDVMRDPVYEEMFPNSGCRLPAHVKEGSWSVAARRGMRDGQPSFKAIGLLTGFVGQGADDLIIDDPYASPQAALSEAIRRSVWMFWQAGAKVRIRPETNVIVMFHRYHSEDIAGQLEAEGGWEVMRFCAIADGNEAYPDPMKREVGEKLTERLTDEFIEEQQRVQAIWLGQFQGIPLPPGGGMLKRNWFRTVSVENVPPLKDLVMGCDLAVSEKTSADYTVAGPLGVDAANNYYLFRPARGQLRPARAREAIIARLQEFPRIRKVGMESVAALSGYVTEMRDEPQMAGYTVLDIGRHSDKVMLCNSWNAIAEQGRIFLVVDGTGWEETFLQETDAFPLGAHDDQVDWVGISFETLRFRVDKKTPTVNPVSLVASVSRNR